MTKNDEKVMQKEVELRETKEKLIEHEQVVENLDKQYQQAMEEKNILAEQLQAETELCAEAEEMRARYNYKGTFCLGRNTYLFLS